MRTVRVLLACGVLLAVAAAPGCGKKGPPLAPLVQVPARVADLGVRRIGDTVFLSFTIPSANLDGTKPADISRVDVYAYTALEASAIRDVRDMARVASIPVRRPPEPEDPPKPGETPKPPEPREPGDDQGAAVVAAEALIPALLTLSVASGKPAVTPPVVEPAVWFDTPLVPALAGPVLEPQPTRFYMVVGVNRRGQRGGASPRIGVPLTVTPPDAPEAPGVALGEKALVITWAPPAGALQPIQAPIEPADAAAAAAPRPLRAALRGMLVPVPLAYNVYLTGSPQSSADAGPPAPPTPLNKEPLSVLTFTDEAVEFGVERCYVVRTVNPAGATAVMASSTAAPPAAPAAGVAAPPPRPAALPSVWVESRPSARTCVTPTDTYPPPVPPSLAGVASDGAISLIWEGVEAADLAGYIVLRGTAPDGELTPIVDAPIRETTFRDTTVKPGVRYIYAVVSVDSSKPPNRSALSNRVEETGR